MTEKNSLPLFLEDIYDALRAAVQSLGGAKPVAGRLWPHKPLEQARKELLDALNRDNPRKLDAEEVIALLRMAREAGFHQAKHWIDNELGYSQSEPVEPETELAKLLREYIETGKRLATTQAKIEETRLKLAK
jgi:hypothetical protein